MKKFFAIVLLICLSLTIMGYHFVFRYQIALAKTQMKNELLSGVHDSEMIHFGFSSQQVVQLEWENGNEFRYLGRMYDVVQKTFANGKIILRCVSDEKETALLKYYLKVNRENQNGSRKIAGILELSLTPFIPVHVTLLPALLNVKPSHKFFPAITYIKECFHMVLTPPPDGC
ncbi:MAG: hypothetical protein ACJ75F_05615 [Flavisolibacter sp.]